MPHLSSSIVNSENLSYDSLREDFLTYVQSRSDYGSWKDILESTAGVTLVELLSGFGAYISYHALVARRESYIDQAKQESSVINIANTIGYNANRVEAASITITLRSNSPLTLDRFTPIGSYLGEPLVPLENRSIIPGISQIKLLVGEWRRFIQVINTPSNFQRIFIDDDAVDNILNEE